MRVLLIPAVILCGAVASAGDWRRLAALPHREGVAGPFAGICNGALLVAGGADFPDKPPWEGGQKVWRDTVFVLERPDGVWKVAGTLPRPLGYGVSVTHGGGVVCVGGSDANRHYADAFRLEWRNGRVITSALPPFPLPVANACGAMVGDTLYVAGGQERPDAVETLKTVWKLDLADANPRWIAIEPFPGPGRILAAASGHDGAFWIVGGVTLFVGKETRVERRYLVDAYRYDARKGWTRISDLPYPIAAAPSPAPSQGSGFVLLGGDTGSQVGVAPDRHRGFEAKVLRYDLMSERWLEAGRLAAPRVTVPCVVWGKSWVVPSGEIRPGIRSPEVWSSIPESSR